MVQGALAQLDLLAPIDLLIVENVGNLVCPAAFRLGTHHNVLIASVPEGDDKPYKYPGMYRGVRRAGDQQDRPAALRALRHGLLPPRRGDAQPGRASPSRSPAGPARGCRPGSTGCGSVAEAQGRSVTVRSGMQGLRIHITGIVQGVGFRPFVYGLAARLGLTGWVRNTSAGVEIEVDGRRRGAARLSPRRCAREAPPLARIDRLESQPQPAAGLRRVRDPSHSQRASRRPSSRSRPTSAICADCLRELFDPRRPALPLPLHQLHQLRPALHHHHATSPTTGPTPPWPASRCARTARPSTTTRATGASTPSRSPARPAGRRSGSRRDGRAAAPSSRRRGHPGARAAAARRARSWPSRGWAASTWPATPPTPRRWPSCAGASGAATSPSP